MTQRNEGIRVTSDLLSRAPLSPAFTPLTYPAWRNLSHVASRRLVAPHQRLCAQNELSESVLVIESGIVKLVHIEPDGSEYIAGLRSDGWMIDAASAVLNNPVSFSAITVTPCEITRVPAESFRRQLAADPALMRDLLVLLCNELQAEREQQVEIRSRSAQSRLMRFLDELGRLSHGRGELSQLPLKQSEVAQLLSITPEHLSRLMHGCKRPACIAEARSRRTPRPEPAVPASVLKYRAAGSL